MALYSSRLIITTLRLGDVMTIVSPSSHTRRMTSAMFCLA
jgi:hypothetical protein